MQQSGILSSQEVKGVKCLTLTEGHAGSPRQLPTLQGMRASKYMTTDMISDLPSELSLVCAAAYPVPSALCVALKDNIFRTMNKYFYTANKGRRRGSDVSDYIENSTIPLCMDRHKIVQSSTLICSGYVLSKCILIHIHPVSRLSDRLSRHILVPVLLSLMQKVGGWWDTSPAP